MKKLFSILAIIAFISALAIGSAHANPVVKMKTQSAMSFATLGAVVMKPTSKNVGVFKWLQEKYGTDRVIAPSYIRMEQYLVNGKAEYEFNHRLLGNEASTERKLNEQDLFRITDIGVFLMQESQTVGGIGVLSTYPNPIQFPDEASFCQNAHFEHIYNGFFTAKIGDTTWCPDLPIGACRTVNTAQQTALATNDSERRGGDGFIPLTPQYSLKGRENNSLKVIVPANSNQKVESQFGVSGYKHKIVMILLGYKVTGAGNTTT